MTEKNIALIGTGYWGKNLVIGPDVTIGNK